MNSKRAKKVNKINVYKLVTNYSFIFYTLSLQIYHKLLIFMYMHVSLTITYIIREFVNSYDYNPV